MEADLAYRDKVLNSFSCPKNPEIEKFFKETSFKFEKDHISRTYWILGSEPDSICILGYFALSFKEIDNTKMQISKTKVKKLHGKNKNATGISTYLIGQIGKNHAVKNNPIDLGEILKYAYGKIKEAQDTVGGRVVLIECEDNEKLIKLYEKNGFEYLQRDKYVQMVSSFLIQ